MNRLSANGYRLSAGMAALGLVLSLASGARADFAYAYAQQAVKNLNISTLAGTLTPASTTTGTTSQAGFVVGTSLSDPLDAPQVFVGSPAPPPQNFFGQVATFATSPSAMGAQPLTPGADFGHGDVQLSNIGNLGALPTSPRAR